MGPAVEHCEARTYLAAPPPGSRLIPTVSLVEDGWYYELKGDTQRIVKIGDNVSPPRQSAFEYLRSVQYQTPEDIARQDAHEAEWKAKRAWDAQVDKEIMALKSGIDPMSVRPREWGGYAKVEPGVSFSPLDVLSSQKDDSILDSIED